MPSLTTAAKSQLLLESRPFYPGQDNNFQAELRQGKVYLTEDGHELGRVAGILLDRGHNRDELRLLFPLAPSKGTLPTFLENWAQIAGHRPRPWPEIWPSYKANGAKTGSVTSKQIDSMHDIRGIHMAQVAIEHLPVRQVQRQEASDGRYPAQNLV